MMQEQESLDALVNRVDPSQMKNQSNRFSYVRYDPEAVSKQEEFKRAFEKVESLADGLEHGRARDLLLNYLEIAYMWTGKALRDDQISRNSQPSHIAERSNQ